MSEVIRTLQDWLTGWSAGPEPALRAVVVEDADAVPALLTTEVISADSTVFVAAPSAAADPVTRNHLEFSGSFTAADDELRFSDGSWLHVRRYGTAEFCCLDLPTVLRIGDQVDFSAFLRDADRAWSSGEFAAHLGHPFAVIPDLAAVGGPVLAAGPRHRIHVARTGAIRTSPTGRVLGQVGDPIEDLQRRWIELNRASRRPDAVGLAAVVSEPDRLDALDERPWLSRYLEILRVIAAVRRTGRVPLAVSGFGGRLVGSGRSPAVDPTGTPVLLRIGDSLVARAAVGDREVLLPVDQVAAIEDGLDGASGSAGGGRAATEAALAGLLEAGIDGRPSSWKERR